MRTIEIKKEEVKSVYINATDLFQILNEESKRLYDIYIVSKDESWIDQSVGIDKAIFEIEKQLKRNGFTDFDW